MIPKNTPQKEDFSIKKNLKLPPYFDIWEDGSVSGYLGHGIGIIKEPIIQGNYYFEV